MAIATLVVVLGLCIAAITALSMQLRCIDAAREAARLAGRGDERLAVEIARRIAPPGAQIQLRRDGEFLVASVTTHSKILPHLEIAADAVAAAEPQ
ncbi:hypothetical protein MB901379_04546 [Mycobacterium basiliense]|uniref:Pilus biosynthesis protein TadE n=1 Tax=Mycobacterium basiliense TaxID=2094119 RepID=A0A447GK96_9MYCO|nr:TadE family type IV pilus minor pilin [Mycobacterium basiliense]VDM90936.1 hypothetical protein MB901379_04546 [Mycobacterium basiliense]